MNIPPFFVNYHTYLLSANLLTMYSVSSFLKASPAAPKAALRVDRLTYFGPSRSRSTITSGRCSPISKNRARCRRQLNTLSEERDMLPVNYAAVPRLGWARRRQGVV